MTVRVKFEKDVKHCYCCPFKETMHARYYTFDICPLLDGYDQTIPYRGIHKSCPFREENKKTLDN